MSVPSFIGGGFHHEPCDNQVSNCSADERTALIGLQALTLNLASANQREASVSPANERQDLVSPTNQRRIVSANRNRPASAPTSRRVKLIESRLPRPKLSPKPSKRPLDRAFSAGFSVDFPRRPAVDIVFEPYCPVHHRCVTPTSVYRQFTNRTNLQVKNSESMDSLSSRSARGGSVNSLQTPNTSRSKSRQQSPLTQPNTPQPRKSNAKTNQSTPKSQQSTPKSRQKTAVSRTSSSQAGSDVGRQFPDYWDVHQVQQGLQKGQLVEGVLRINPKNYKDAYISAPDGQTDIYIAGVYDRNRALHGDIVAVELFPSTRWQVLDQALLSYLHLEGSFRDLPLLFSDTSSLSTSLPRLELLLPCNDRFPRPLHKALGVEAADQACHSSARMTVAQRLFAFSPLQEQTGNDPESLTDSVSKLTMSKSVVAHQQPVSSEPVDVALGVSLSRACKHPCWGRFVQRTGRVVAITRQLNSRRCVGSLRRIPTTPSADAWVLFWPRDSRVPRMKVLAPVGVDWREDTLFLAELTSWPAPGRALGALCSCLGESGAADVEMRALLADYAIEDDLNLEEDEDSAGEWSLSEQELVGRRDFRSECVFTIDPLTARDLDDAVSIRSLPNSSLYEIGVHIADVSHFVRPGSVEDLRASRTTSSVYLPQRVIPMLPRRLCERACSLRAGSDRLAFSVLFTVDDQARVKDTWFGRSVINSCCQLAYDHVQEWIDGVVARDLPEFYGGWDVAQVRERVMLLHKVAQQRRTQREISGALRLDQVKVGFSLDSEGRPLGVHVREQTPANWLIEELMLLANSSVAERLSRLLPERAVLRLHPEPSGPALGATLRQLAAVGAPLQAESSGALQASLRALHEEWRRDLGPRAALDRMQVVVHLLSRPMESARYFCAGSSNKWRHYALSIDVYTHFTSPIRRYADVLVHRQLAATIEGGQGVIKVCVGELGAQLSVCNNRRESIRACVEKCNELCLSQVICSGEELGGVWEALVCQVLDGSMDVLILGLALVKRVYINRVTGLVSAQYSMEQGLASWKFQWERCGSCDKQLIQRLQIFSQLKVKLCSGSDSTIKFDVNILKPECCQSSKS